MSTTLTDNLPMDETPKVVTAMKKTQREEGSTQPDSRHRGGRKRRKTVTFKDCDDRHFDSTKSEALDGLAVVMGAFVGVVVCYILLKHRT